MGLRPPTTAAAAAAPLRLDCRLPLSSLSHSLPSPLSLPGQPSLTPK